MRNTKDATERATARRRLRELLGDPDQDVRRAAASALGDLADEASLDPILALLEAEPGDRFSPFAFAATFIELHGSIEEKRRVLLALDRFAIKGPSAATQVDRLAWRLDEHPKAYPGVIHLYE